jgi:hypothetical protein
VSGEIHFMGFHLASSLQETNYGHEERITVFPVSLKSEKQHPNFQSKKVKSNLTSPETFS